LIINTLRKVRVFENLSPFYFIDFQLLTKPFERVLKALKNWRPQIIAVPLQVK